MDWFLLLLLSMFSVDRIVESTRAKLICYIVIIVAAWVSFLFPYVRGYAH